jgi:hypothetical protein
MNDNNITRKLMKEALHAITRLTKHQHFDGHVALREIRIHMLDEDGDGLGVWIEYNEDTGELDKGMMPISSEMMAGVVESEGAEMGEPDDADADDSWPGTGTLGRNELLN